MSSDFDWFVLSIYGLLLSLTIQCFAKNSCGLLEWILQVRSNAGLSFDERIEIAAKAFVLRVELILYCWIPNSSDCWVSISGLGCCFVPNPKTGTAPWDPGILEPAFGLHNCVNSTCPYLFNISWNKVGMTFWYSELVDAYRFASCKAMFGADSRCTGLAYRPNMMRPRSKSWCSAKHCRLWSFIQWSKGTKKNCEQSWDTMQIVSWHGQQQFNMRHGLLLTWHCSLSCRFCPGQWDWSQAAVEKGRSRPTSAPVRPSKLSPNQQAMLQEQCAESLHFQFFLSNLQLPGSAA